MPTNFIIVPPGLRRPSHGTNKVQLRVARETGTQGAQPYLLQRSRHHHRRRRATAAAMPWLGHTAVTVVYARAIFNLSSGKVGPLVALLLRVDNLVILGYLKRGAAMKWDAIITVMNNNLVCLF